MSIVYWMLDGSPLFIVRRSNSLCNIFIQCSSILIFLYFLWKVVPTGTCLFSRWTMTRKCMGSWLGMYGILIGMVYILSHQRKRIFSLEQTVNAMLWFFFKTTRLWGQEIKSGPIIVIRSGSRDSSAFVLWDSSTNVHISFSYILPEAIIYCVTQLAHVLNRANRLKQANLP